MCDLISRQDAIRLAEQGQIQGFEWQFKKLCELPSAEPERKKGKWIYKDDLKEHFCSECGYPSLTYDDVYIYSMDLPNFCEDCGADMRGEED